MRLIFTLLIGLAFSLSMHGQTLLFSENFETNTLPDSVGSVGTATWAKSSTLFSQGARSDSSRIVNPGDTSVLTTLSFATTGNSFVMLHFDHICKIEFFDEAYIEVSNDNGITWTRLTGAQYQGASQFTTQGNKFTAAAYTTDWAAGSYAVPTNAWWKSEIFDISLLVGNAANVKVRFVLRDASPGNIMPDNYAWFIDNIRVFGAFSELNPPILTMLPPIVQDTVYSTGPYVVRAHITDQSLIDTAYLVYWVNVGTPDTIGMTRLLADTFSASIPFFGFGKNIHYYVVAIDGSGAHNVASSSTYHFYCKFSTGGTYTIGTGISVNTSTGYPTPYGNYYWGSKEQYLILASEMTALGMPGGPISSLAFNVSALNSVPPLTGFYIKMGHTPITALSAFITTGLNSVYTTTSYMPVVGWNTHTFQTPFVWNGVDNVVIEVCFNNSSYPLDGNAGVLYGSTPFVGTLNFHTDNATVCSAPGTPTTYQSRPNMKIEILGVTSLTLDAGVGQIVYPTGGVIANAPFAVTAKVKNFGTDTLTAATVNWRLDGVLQTPYSWTGSLLKDSLSSTITLGTITLPMGVHNIVAWTDNPNGQPDLNTGNDSSKISFMACANLLSGTYTIGGTNPDFVDFTAAIIALDQCGINAPVVFNVAPGTYNEQLVIPWISGTSAVNTITFQSATPDSTLVTLAYTAAGTASNYILKLDGAEYITFKNIKFLPGSTTFATSLRIAGGAQYNTIKGNYFVGKPGTTDDLMIIRCEDVASSDNLIHGNMLEDGSIGIYFKGANSSNRLDRITIKDNYLSGFTSCGIKAEFVSALLIDGNIVSSAIPNSGLKQGIHLNYSYDTTKVTRNRIILEGSTNTNGIQLENCTASVGLEGLVANNFITILNGANLTYGMRIITTGRQKIYFNSLRVYGNSNTDTRGINTVSSSSNIFVLNNNIESNKFPTFYEGASCARSNYNNLWSTGNLYGFYTTSTQTYTNLAAYKAASQKDTNSVSVNTYFTSPTDLHTGNGLLNGIATPVPEVTVDIDLDVRDLLMPDIGADEFIPSPVDATVLTIASPLQGCGKTSTEQVTMVIKNVGTAVINTGLSGNFRFNNSPTIVTEAITANILPGDTFFYTFNATVNMDVTSFGIDSVFKLEVWSTLTGDFQPQNDSVTVYPESYYTPPAPTATNTSVVYAHPATLTAVSNDTLFWFTSDTATTEIFMGDPYITPPLYDTTTYWVSAGVFAAGLGTTGAGTINNGTTSYPAVYGNYYWGAKHQMLVTAAELTAMGFKKGNIKSLAFDVTNVNACPALMNFEIKVGQTTITAVTTTWESGLTSVFLNPSYQPVVGWNTHLFTTPFYWDGVSNLIFETCFNNSNYLVNGNASMNQTATSFASTHWVNNDVGTVCSAPNPGSVIAQRPNMRIGMESAGCQSAKVPLTVFVTGFPPIDAGVVTVLNPSVSTPSGLATPITVELKNYGLNPLLNVNIVWKLNSVVQDTFAWTGNLVMNASQIVTIDTAIFAGGSYCIDAFTFLPNGVQDTINNNDTASTCFSACMSGVYTIGPAATGTYDYNTFNSALSTLIASGICGHVVFDVYPGTYTEQLTIPSIAGMDSSNTVTFRGFSGDSTDAILQYTAAGASDYWTIRLNGADWFRFEKMTIKGLGITYARTVELMANANYNTFSNCVISTPVSTSSYFVPLYVSSSVNSYNQFFNNVLQNGYYGIYWYGTGTTTLTKGTVFKGNLLQGFYYYGAYLYYFDSLIFTQNTIRNLTGFANGYGVFAGYCQNFSQFTKNKVEVAPTGTMYGAMYMSDCTGTAASRGLVANNFISITGTGTGAHYGLRSYYSNYQDFIHNSINVTSGSATARAFDFYYGTMNNSLNNYARNTGSGYALYVTAGSSLNLSDHNNYWGTSSLPLYWAANYGTLAAMRTVTGKDMNSHSLNAQFMSATDLHLLSTNLSSKGIASPLVTDDIDGELRSLMPTIGADEVPLLPTDAGVITILTPGTLLNEGQVYPVEVVVINYGTDTLFSMNVQYTVNNGAPVTTVYTGVLPTLAMDTLVMPSMTSPAGNSVICAKTLLVGDTNYFNDEYCKNFFGTPVHDATVYKAIGPESGCGLGLDTVKIWVKNLGASAINHPTPSVVTVSYQINGALPVVTETFTPVLQNHNDSALFVFSTLGDFSVTTQTDTMLLKAWVNLAGDNVKYNDTSWFETVSMHTPALPVVTSPVTIPYATSVTLTAQSPTNDTLMWFATATDSVEILVGASLTTPVLYQDTTYWVQAVTGSSTAAGVFIITEQCHFKYSVGAPVAGWPTWLLADDYIEITGPANADLGGITLEQWSATSMLSTHTFPTGTLLSPNGIAIIAVGEMYSSQPSPANFYYHGNGSYTSSFSSSTLAGRILKAPNGTIIDAACYGNFTFPAIANVPAADWSNPVTSSGVSTSGFRLIGPDLNTGANWVVSSSINPQNPGVQNNNVPQPKGIGCASARVPVQVFVANAAACDVGVSTILQPTSMVNLGANQLVSVLVANYGTASQTNIPVSYQIDNQPVVTETITATIASNGTFTYNFTATANLSNVGNTYQFRAWTGLTCDSTQQNDTAWKTVQNFFPSYCISTATSTGYEDLTNVTLHTLNNSSLPVGSMYTNFSATVAPPMLSPGVSYPISITTDFPPSYSYQYSCWVKVWIDFNRNGVFDDPSEMIFSSATTSSNTVTGTVSIPPTAFTGNTLMRVVFVETSLATSVNPCGTYSWGETEDYMVTINPLSACDAGVIAIVEPTGTTQGGAVLPVRAVIMNFGSDPIAANTLSVAYVFNGGTPVITPYPGSLPTMGTDTVVLPNVTAIMGNNTLCVYTILACDSTLFNNEICTSVYGQYYTTLPYFDDFETSNMWYKPATFTNWQYGTPSGTLINAAYSGSKSWVTNLAGDYTNNANEYIYTPVFDFTGLGGTDTITLSFYHWVVMAASDYGRVQYTIDGGQSWSNLGFFGDPLGTNWYNTQVGGVHYFSVTNSSWMYSAYKLVPNTFNGQQEVQFRFNFVSNTSVVSEGWAIDNFRLALPLVGNDIGVTAINYPIIDTAAGSQVHVKITISNFGTNPQVTFPVALKLNGATLFTETWTGNLAPQSTATYTFTQPFVVPSAAYTLCAETQLVGDAFPSNNSTCKNFTPLPAYHDVGVSRILTPPGDSVGNICFFEATTHSWYKYDVDVRIKNYGQNTQTSIPITYTFFNGGPVHTDTWNGSLAAGDSVDVTLDEQFLPKLGAQQICVETSLMGDLITTNNKACKTLSGVTCIGIDDLNVVGFILEQNVPNPASQTTAIGYMLPMNGDITFGVVNMVGQVLHSEVKSSSAGYNQIHLDLSGFAAGVYYYFVEYNGLKLTKKLIVRN
jgi:hypothetical protein